MNANTRYEIQALAFYRLHNCLAPGKDEAARSASTVSQEERQRLWDEWHATAGPTIAALLNACETLLEEHE